MRKLLYSIPMLFFVGLGVFFYLGLAKDPGLLPSALIGEAAPPIALAALNEQNPDVTSETLQGQIVLVNFFASWCGPCRIEHPLLMAIAEKGELPIYGINYKDAKINATRWLAELGDPFDAIGVDLQGGTGIDWGVYGLPETFLVNADGQIIYKHVGPLTPEAFNTEIMPRVRELQK